MSNKNNFFLQLWAILCQLMSIIYVFYLSDNFGRAFFNFIEYFVI
jgi:hypothetical protein